MAGIVPSSAVASLSIGGRVFTAAEMARFQSGTTGVILYGFTTTTNTWATLRTANGSTGYQVPSGKTLTVLAIRCGQFTTAQGYGPVPVYGDTDVGMSSGAAPTNPVYFAQSAATKFGPIMCNGTNGVLESTCEFQVPQNKYVGVYSVGANFNVAYFCTIS